MKKILACLIRTGAGPALLAALFACTQITPRANVPYEERPSPNFNERHPNYVIIHYTSHDEAERSRFSRISRRATRSRRRTFSRTVISHPGARTIRVRK